MPTLILCRGLQGSGKSTFSEAWVAKNPEKRTRINRDLIRNTYYNSYWGESVDEDGVTVIEHSIAQAVMAQGIRDIIIDNTNVKDESVIPYLLLANAWGYEVKFKDFEVDVDELIRRDSLRDRKVGEPVIRSYAERYLTNGRLPAVPTI